MGNKSSTLSTVGDKGIFAKELAYLEDLVNNIITEQNMFQNRSYNFLSQDVCDQHFVLMENELNRHLKVELQGVGSSLYLIPKDGELQSTINKKDLCKKISNHYMKILYILCLVKYVYNTENNGDLSIAGIIFRNVKVVDAIMEMNFCNVPHKDYSKPVKFAYKIDFGKLEGLEFFTKYFLEPTESVAYVKVLRKALARAPKKVMQKTICQYVSDTKPRVEHLKQLEKSYRERFHGELGCNVQKGGSNPVSLLMYVEKDNPVFSREHCYEIHKYIIQLNNPYGTKVKTFYEQMKTNYKGNVSAIERLVGLLVNRGKDGRYVLKDVSKTALEDIIAQVKDVIKMFYLQSLLDYHTLLDIGKNTPNINMVK